MNLSITRAWDETAAFVKQEAGVLFLIIFALGVLPGLILQALFAKVFAPLQASPGAVPDMGPFVAVMPLFLALLIPVMVLSLWGSLTVNMLALRRETVIGSAFRRAASRILPLLGATLLLLLAGLVVALPVVGAMGLGFGAGRVGLAVLVMLVFWLILVFIGVRLMLMTAVAAAERAGPIAIIRRSWQLSSGHFWRLLGFLLLMLIVFFVLLIVVGSVGGILLTATVGQPHPGTVGSFLLQLVIGILQAIWATYFIVLVARIYEQLSGNVGSVAGVFE